MRAVWLSSPVGHAAMWPWCWLSPQRYPYYSYTVEDLLCGSSISKITASWILLGAIQPYTEQFEIRKRNHLLPSGKIHYKWPFSIAMLVHQRVVSFLSHRMPSYFFNVRRTKSESVSGKAWWHLQWFGTNVRTCILKTCHAPWNWQMLRNNSCCSR